MRCKLCVFVIYDLYEIITEITYYKIFMLLSLISTLKIGADFYNIGVYVRCINLMLSRNQRERSK